MYPRGYLEPSLEYRERVYQLIRSIDEILERHGIVYWAEAGTLLGVVRHAGLIPWDDDVDIVIPYAEMENIIALQPVLAEKELVLHFNYNRICFANDPQFAFSLRMRERSSLPQLLRSGGFRSGAKLCRDFLQSSMQAIFRWNSYPYVDIAYKIHHADGYEFIGAYELEHFPEQSLIRMDELYPLRRAAFGTAQVNIPAEPEPYLSRAFGDWRTQQISFPHGSPWILRIFSLFLKRTLPIG
jgi:hypothetical protein